MVSWSPTNHHPAGLKSYLTWPLSLVFFIYSIGFIEVSTSNSPDALFRKSCSRWCIEVGHCELCREYSDIGTRRSSTVCCSKHHHRSWPPSHSTFRLYCHCYPRKSCDRSLWTTSTIHIIRDYQEKWTMFCCHSFLSSLYFQFEKLFASGSE